MADVVVYLVFSPLLTLTVLYWLHCKDDSTHFYKTLVAPLGGGNCMGDTYLLRSSAVIKMRSGRTHLRDYQSSNSGLLCLDCPAGVWLAP